MTTSTGTKDIKSINEKNSSERCSENTETKAKSNLAQIEPAREIGSIFVAKNNQTEKNGSLPSRISTKEQNEEPTATNRSQKTILLINTGSIKKKFILQKLKKMNLQLVVLNKEKNWAQPYVDYWILADNTNHNDSLQAVKAFLDANPNVKVDGVITFWEDDVLLTSKIIDKFDFVGIPYRIAKKVRNKYLFREFCSNNQILTPKFRMVRSESDLSHIATDFEFPVVMKPAYGASSAFVVKIESKEELTEMYQYVKNNISTNVESALSDGLDIFVEEFIDGDEVDIDIILQNGKIKFYSIADNYNKNKGIFFVDSGQAIPSSLPFGTQEKMLETAEETLEKLGIQNGCIHFEAKCSSKGIYPIEVNLRMGGDYVYSYTKSAWGIDLIECTIKIAYGEFIKIQKPAFPRRYIIGWDLHPDSSGILAELNAPEEIKRYNFVEEFEIYKSIGDPIFVPPEGFEHLGWVTVWGENLLDAQDNLDKTLGLINYKVVRFDPESFLGKTERKNRFSPAVLNKDFLIRTAKIKAIDEKSIRNLKKLRIGILGNIYPNTSDPIEAELTETAKGIEETLKKNGYNTVLLNLNDLSKLIETLKKGDIDLIFNVGERLHGAAEYKPHIASLLDVLQIPYTGSDPFTLSLAADKIRFKKLLTYHDIPTPAWDYVYELDDEINPNLEYPLIVKPADTDHLIGITNASVVKTKEELNIQLQKIIKEMNRPALIEKYIDGDEYEVYILGNEEKDLRVLPLARSIFDNLPPDYWHIYTFEEKWLRQEPYSQIIFQLPAKNISQKLQSLITEIALDSYNIFDCQDYGKVEIKVDKDSNPYVLEINPHPWLAVKEEGMTGAAKLVGIDYTNLLDEIIALAIKRYKT